jgi:putative hemolysin
MISEIVELDGMRVREIMLPRVDMLVLDESCADPLPVVQEALARYQTWLPVVRGTRDEVVGHVLARDVLRHPGRDLAELVMPVKFVPEVATALSLLLEFQLDRTAEAVVVDEWGGTAGLVTIEDVFEEIVGELRVEGEGRRKPVVPLGEGRYRVSGSLSVRDWNERFGHQIVPKEFETVGGLVTAMLGRIPRAGDQVRLGNLLCEVDQVRGRRVLSVDMSVVSEATREEP